MKCKKNIPNKVLSALKVSKKSASLGVVLHRAPINGPKANLSYVAVSKYLYCYTRSTAGLLINKEEWTVYER